MLLGPGVRRSDRIRAQVGTRQLKGMLTLKSFIGTVQRRQVCRELRGADRQREEGPSDEQERLPGQETSPHCWEGSVLFAVSIHMPFPR